MMSTRVLNRPSKDDINSGSFEGGDAKNKTVVASIKKTSEAAAEEEDVETKAVSNSYLWGGDFAAHSTSNSQMMMS